MQRQATFATWAGAVFLAAAGCSFQPVGLPQQDAGGDEVLVGTAGPNVSLPTNVAKDGGTDTRPPDAPVDAPSPPDGATAPDGDPPPADACAPACTVGAKRCGTGGLQTCVATNGCATWSSDVPCKAPMTCQGSSPEASCACPAAPAGCTSGQGSFCESGTVVATCATDALGCVKIASRVTCPDSKPCSGAHPSASCSCAAAPPACAAGSGSSCQGNTLVTCAVDANGCIAASTQITCPAGRPCQGTAPNAACTCPAPPAGCSGAQDRFCDSSSTVAQCGLDRNQCLVVTQRTTCPGGKPCMGSPNAACTCLSPPSGCAGQSGTFCESGTSVATCGINSSNGCLDILGRSSCTSGKACTGSAPSAQCTCPAAPADCSGPGNVCRANNTLATCGFDGNGCLTTTGSAPCASGKTCSGSFPGAACTCPAPPSDCSGAGTVCRGNTLATCGFDGNGCLTTTNTTTCSGACSGSFPGASCGSNNCGPSPTCDNGTGCPCVTSRDCFSSHICNQPSGVICNGQSTCTCQPGCVGVGGTCLNQDDCCIGTLCNGFGKCQAMCRANGQACHFNQDCCTNNCVIDPGFCWGACR
jgi:hypothetical protein